MKTYEYGFTIQQSGHESDMVIGTCSESDYAQKRAVVEASNRYLKTTRIKVIQGDCKVKYWIREIEQ